MQPKLSLLSFANRRGARGTTLTEMLVSITISTIIAAMVVSLTMANRRIYQKDIGRTLVNQNIRSALDIVGTEIRQAGELFPGSFPAILLTNGASGAPDTLTIRRNLLSQVLVGCDARTAGTSYNRSNLSRASPITPACTYANQRNSYNAWFSHVGGLTAPPTAYIFNQTTKNGEFLQLRNTSPATNFGGDSASTLYLNFNSKTFANTYAAETTSIYMMNQWVFRMSGDVLQIVVNNDTANPRNIIDGILNFQVSALMQDGTTKTALVSTDNWTTVRALRVTMTGRETVSGATTTRSLSSDFFPRNILSN